MSAAPIGRNAPCPCGSGKRYKDCHGTVVPPASETTLAPEDLLGRARVAWLGGDTRAATTTCHAALARAPQDIAAWNLLGEILQSSDAGAAERAWREALRLDPHDPEALFHLGNRHRERGEFDEAISHYERALLCAPGHPGMLNNLALGLEAKGHAERAETCFRQALQTQPGHADALANLAGLLHRKQRHREAVATYAKAIAVRRDFSAEFWSCRGVSLGEIGALADAEASFREAARLEPGRAQIHMDIGSACVIQGKFDAAEKALARAAELAPDNAYIATMLAFSRMQCCAWEGLEALFATVRRSVENETSHTASLAVPFPLLAMPLGPRIELAAARRWAQYIAARVKPHRVGVATHNVRAATRLRVGFVSSDFRDHPVAHLLIDYWERSDRTRIETYAYGLVPRDPGAFAQRVVHAFDRFIDCGEDSIEDTTRRIAQDGIDVLVDLNGYTTHAKSEIFVSRPAPVQVSWLGYLGTLGAPWYDYVLTDRFVVPPAQQAFFTERALYLPDCYCPSDTRRPVAPQVPDRAACGLPPEGVVFCCFNNSYKILPHLFDVWMRLLVAVPGSVLWLSPGQATAGVNLRREARARGVDPLRLVFAPRVNLPEHLARHAHADLFLDTTPYNAGTTANDALFMGVPVLTCAGDTMASRVAGSQLTAIGLPELITTNLADYEALALSLARDKTRLAQTRARLAANRPSAPLFDMARFTRALDDLLLATWENRPSPPN